MDVSTYIHINVHTRAYDVSSDPCQLTIDVALERNEFDVEVGHGENAEETPCGGTPLHLERCQDGQCLHIGRHDLTTGDRGGWIGSEENGVCAHVWYGG